MFGGLTRLWSACPNPREKEIWRLVSDAQAALHIAEGKRFQSMAPIRYAIYRDDPLSGWVPTSKNKRRKLAGYCSHEYIGRRPAEWCGELIHAKDLSGTTFKHKRGSLYVHKLWDMASYDGSCVWLCENLSTGLAELWRSCDLRRITRRGQRRNKIAHGGYRLPSPGLAGVREHFDTMHADAQRWLAEFKLHGVQAADELVFGVTK